MKFLKVIMEFNLLVAALNEIYYSRFKSNTQPNKGNQLVYCKKDDDWTRCSNIYSTNEINKQTVILGM